MSPSAWVLALAATLVAGGAGLASVVVVAELTRAPRLRYAACTTALAFALAPLVMSMGFGIVGDHPPHSLTPMNLARSAVTFWTSSAETPSWSWMLARSAPALMMVYGGGLAACLARLGWRWLALRRVLREARAPEPGRLKGVPSPLPVRITDRAPSALLIGLRRPIAVLPARALEQMTAAQLRWVLAHEAAHARRGDNLRLLAEELLRAVLWFNPFVTRAAILAAEAREQLCDQSALGAADAAQRRAYAETLLLALRLGSQSELASMLVPHGKRSLSMRLKEIMKPARPTPATAVASFGAMAAAGLLAFAVGAAAWAQTPPLAGNPAQAGTLTRIASAPARGLTIGLLDQRGAAASKLVISGDMVVETSVAVDRQGRSVVRFRLTPEGASRLASVTRDNIGRRMAIMVDGNVVSAPVIRAEIGGAGQISGNFTAQQARTLAAAIDRGRAS